MPLSAPNEIVVADVYPPKFLRSKILRTRGKKHGTDIIVGETAILTQDDIAAFVKEMERAEGEGEGGDGSQREAGHADDGGPRDGEREGRRLE